jgi:hypothetical protein
MPSALVAAVMVGIALIVSVLVLRRRSLPEGAARSDGFHCVAITFSDDACDAVKNVRSHRFLSHEAPFLPLDRCTVRECRCRYEHFPDRREDMRRNPYGSRRSLPPAAISFDRRFVTDRRAHFRTR